MASFPYNGNIPGPNDQLSVSQGQIQTNFSSIQSLIDVNHLDFSSTAAGKHLIVTLPAQTGGSPLPTLGGEVALFCANGNTSAVPEIWLQKQSAAAPYTITESKRTTNGWSTLPSGVLIQWGQVTFGPPGFTSKPVLFSPSYSTSVFTIQITVNPTNSPSPSLGAFSFISAISVAGFTINFSTTVAAANVYWFALGV